MRKKGSKTRDIILILMPRFIHQLSFFSSLFGDNYNLNHSEINKSSKNVNVLLIRNLQIGYLMVEGASEEEDLEDPYQGGLPTCLPYTLESFKAGSKQSPGFPKKGACSTFFNYLRVLLRTCGYQGKF